MVSREGYEAYKKKRQEQERQGITPAVSKERREELLKGYNEWKAKTGRMQQDLTTRMESLAESGNRFSRDYAARFGNRNGTDGGKYLGDATKRYQSAREQKKLFDTEADSILEALDQYGEYFDQDWAASVRDYLGKARTDQDNMLLDYAADSQYWAQFGNEEGYIQYQTAQKGIEAFHKDQKEKEGQTEEKNWFEKALARLGASGDSTLPGANISQVVSDYRKDDSYQNPTDQWTNEHWQNFGYLYETDPEKANEYAQQVNNFLSAQKKAGQRAQIQEKATDNFVGGAAHSIGALAASPFGLADYLDALAEFNARGAVTEKENITPFEYSQAVTEGVSKHLNEEHGTLNKSIPVIGGKGWGDVYGLGTSIAQSTLSAYTGGSGEALVTFFGSAATSGMKDAKARGASDEQAIAYGFLSGVAEAVPEMLSIESLMNIGSSETLRQFFVNVAKQGGAEALEEGMTSTLNLFADNIVNGDFSNMNILTRDYMAKGLDEDEAKRQAWKDIAEDIAYDMLSGFASGSIHAAPHTAMETYSRNSQISNVYGSSVPELIQQGLESAEGSLSHELAMKYQSKLDNGGSISGADINRLIKANEQQFLAEDAANIQQAAENRLTELGETGDLGTLAGALTKQVTKQRLSRTERAAIQNSQYGLRVANELDPQNIESEQYASGWAEQIGTSRIHDQAYNRNRVEQPVVEIDGDGSQADTLLSGQTTTDNAKTFRGGAQPASQGATQTAPRAAEQADAQMPGNVHGTEKTPSQGRYEVSGSGSAQLLHTGEPVSIRSVAEIRDGKMTLELKDGRKVSAEEISYASEDEALVYEAVAEMGVKAEVANVLLEDYRLAPNIRGEAYAKGMRDAYQYGVKGYPASELANGTFTGQLTETQRMHAYGLGKSGAITGKTFAAANNAVTPKKNIRRMGRVKGIGITIAELNKAFNVSQQKAYKILSTISEVTGIDVVLYRSKVGPDGKLTAGIVDGIDMTGAQGAFSFRNDKIYIDVNAGLINGAEMSDVAKYSMLRTFSHEFIHFIEKHNAVEYENFRDLVFETMRKNGGDPDSLIEDRMRKDGNPDRERASREVVAEAMTDILSQSHFVENLAQKHRSLFEKLHDKLREFAKRIRDYFDSIGMNTSAEAAILKETVGDSVRYTEDIVKMFDRIAEQAVEHYQAQATAQKNTAQEDGVQMHARTVGYDYSKSFSQQVDDYKQGKIPKGDTLTLGGTPVVYQSIGFNALPMTINTTHVDYALNGTRDADHHLGESLLKQLPDSIKTPIAVFVSQTHGTTSVISLLGVVVNGKQAVVPIVIDGFGFQNNIRIDANAITSVYGKTTAVKQLFDAVQDEANGKFSLLFANKKEAVSLLQRAGHQLSGRLIPHDGFYHSIRESSSPVKPKFNNATETQQFKRWFGDWQRHPQNASKVVNADGTPKVVYHGTNKSFTVFKSKDGCYWFSENEDYAESMAEERGSKTVMQAYLNMRRPYRAKLPPGQFSDPGYEAPIIRTAKAGNYDGVIIEVDTDIELEKETFYVVFDSTQIKSATDNIGTFDGSNPDIRYQERTSTLTSRDILANALETVAQNEDERRALQKYRANIQKTVALEEEVTKSRSELRELRAKKGKTQAEKGRMEQLQNAIAKAEADIKNYDSTLLKLEAAKPVKDMLARERTRAQRMIRENHKERASVTKQRAIVEKQVKDLTKMIANPTKDAHVPTVLHEPLQELFNSLDFSSKQRIGGGEATVRDLMYTRALNSIRTAISDQRTAMDGVEDGTFALDVPPKILELIDDHVKAITKATKGLELTNNRVYEMGSEELKELAKLLTTINTAVRNIDKLHMEGAKARVSELADSTVREMGQRKPVKGEDGGGLMWANYTPTYAFERMGTAATQILDGLKQGQAKMARTVDGVLKFAAKTYDAKEVKAWQEKIHTVKLESGETVKLTTAQIMSFYCLSNRDQGVGHLTGGGIRVGTIGEGLGKIVQSKDFVLTVEDINQINGLLDKRQLEVAKAMQKYMQDVGGRLGNEISMARWGFMQMTEENYFPVKSHSNSLDAKAPGQEKANLFALLNKSFTKSTKENANNVIVVNSIFDVFADHMAEMAEYNAFALPLVDAMKWYNYRRTTHLDGTQIDTMGVKKALNDTLGTAAGKYFIDLMMDINGSQKGGRHEDIMGKLLSYSKASSVGWNLRVAIQQPTAILRASLYLDMPDLARGSLRIGTKELVEEMQKYSGIALWKSLGYYDLNVSRSVREQIKGNTNLVDTFNEWGMWLPGKVDEITWARIWAACKSKVSRTQNLKGEALLKETAKLFDDVVYHTQVVDSVLTKSYLMRDKTLAIKELTSFMSEPTLSVNILMSAFQDYRQGKTNWEKAKRTFAICFKGYALSAMANALVTAFADAFRDDDEYEEFWEKYKQALLGENLWDGNLFSELNPLEKVVSVRDVLSAIKGHDVKNQYAELIQSCIDLVNNIKKYLEGKGSITEYGIIYNALKVLGNFTGAAPANLARELVTIWNNTFGKLSGKKIHRYQTETKDAIHNAFDAGTLTREEAIRELVLAQEAENEDEAYFQVKKWETGEDSKYDGLYEALEKNEGVDAAVKELTDHGVKEKDAQEQIRKKLKTWYTDPESEIQMSRKDILSRLKKYAGLDSDEAEEVVKKWDMEKETGFTYDGLREQYVEGNISEKEAISYMQKYGGELKGDAEEKVLKWTCEKETGIAYDNLREEYVNNRVSKDKVVAYLQKYGGIYKANAEKTAREWTCEKETGIAYEDISSAYVTGKITASRAMDLRMLYGGYSREDARETVLEWQCEKDNGVKFDDIETAYKSGEISGSTAQKWLVKYGEQDPTDVAQKINAYDWQLAHPQYSLTVSQVISYTKQVEKLGYSIEYSGIDPEVFVKYLNLSGKCKGTDSNGDGKADSGSIKQEIMDVIHSLPISSKQKDALYLYNGWSKSKLWQAPWH